MSIAPTSLPGSRVRFDALAVLLLGLLALTAGNVPFGDLNGDGRLDMFVADHGWDAHPFPGEQNRLYLSRPGGGWRDATGELPQLSDFSHSAAIGDVRGRGVIDIIVGNGYGGQNRILAYALLNDGDGSFVLDRAILPVGPGETMHANSAHHFPGTVLTDLDGDGLPELIVTADGSRPYHRNHNSTIFWNRSGAFSEQHKTVLPKPEPFVDSHIDLHAAGIDADDDGLPDLLVVGTQGNPFYDGWFVQLLMNRGGGAFIDETPSRFRAAEWFGGSVGVETGAPWAQWVRVLDFNGDGVSDFAVAPVRGRQRRLPRNHPLIWLNDGNGRFAALEVQDFVRPEQEWRVAGSQLMRTRHGYSLHHASVLPWQRRSHRDGIAGDPVVSLAGRLVGRYAAFFAVATATPSLMSCTAKSLRSPYHRQDALAVGRRA